MAVAGVRLIPLITDCETAWRAVRAGVGADDRWTNSRGITTRSHLVGATRRIREILVHTAKVMLAAGLAMLVVAAEVRAVLAVQSFEITFLLAVLAVSVFRL